ncbi:hypothetical protein PENTCL1PPCAC_20665, partial [Pristionchus entomophagus]
QKIAAALALLGAVSAFNLLLLSSNGAIPNVAPDITGEALVEYVNHAQSLFKTAVPKKSYRNRLMAIKHTRLPEDTVFNADVPISAALPTNFDSRAQWPACKGIGAIRDQSSNGSCCAFGAAEAMSDRVCIASSGANQPTLSADDLPSCCGFFCGYGCDGGYPIRAWTYLS